MSEIVPQLAEQVASEDDQSDASSCSDSNSDSSRRRDCYQARDSDEKKHFLDVCYSLVKYRSGVARDIEQMERQVQQLLNEPADLALWDVEDPNEWKSKIIYCIDENAKFLRLLPCPEVCGVDLGENSHAFVRTVPLTHRVASRNSSKVRSTLRQFVRDWASEGQPERDACYAPVIDALLRHLPPKVRRSPHPPSVLVPGCGLARLPFELVRNGYAAQGNEFSYHMLLGSHLILNRCAEAEYHTIYPYATGIANRRGKNDHLRMVKIPDICPSDVVEEGAPLSIAAGEFIEVYKDQDSCWDAVVSCFFLDTAKNIFLYIRTIAQIIRRDGLWVNLGPLLFHYADMTHEVSIELSWEEVRPAICRYFDILEEDRRRANYTANNTSLSEVRYNCIYFVAKRNSVPVSGISNPIY